MKNSPLLEILSTSEFFLNTGLYQDIEIENSEVSTKQAMRILYNPHNLDCRCIECDKDSIFKYFYTGPEYSDVFKSGIPGIIVNGYGDWLKSFEKINEIFTVQFKCSRDENHILTFIVYIKNCKISKIGQSTSFADLEKHTISEYKKILGNEHFIEFSKAIGLYAHGVGAGSLVYLRRIVENFIIKPAYDQAKLKPDWDEDKYQRARVRDKIELLKDELPEFLVDNSVFYSVVSKGIHELNEEECKLYFPVLKACLEEVLSDLDAKRQKEIRRAETKKALDTIAGKISK